MKLGEINDACLAVSTLLDTPLHPNVLQGLTHADTALGVLRDAAFRASQAEIAGKLTPQERQEILDELWDALIAP